MFFSSECKHIGKQLWGHANGSLSNSDLERVETHLHGCESCRREAESYRQTVTLMAHLRQEAVPASRKGWRDMEVRLDTASRAPRRSLFPTLVWSGGLVASAALLLLFVAPAYHTVNSEPPQHSTHPTVTGQQLHGAPDLQAGPQIVINDPDLIDPTINGDEDGSIIPTRPTPHDFGYRSHPPIVRSVRNPGRSSLVITGHVPHNLPTAPHDSQLPPGQSVDGGSSPQVQPTNYVLSPVGDPQGQNQVIDTVSSSSSGTGSGSDGTEEQHPY